MFILASIVYTYSYVYVYIVQLPFNIYEVFVIFVSKLDVDYLLVIEEWCP